MPLSPGTRWGSCDIVSKIGEGGMGEVYRARDTRLDRDVALKVLPPSFAADPDRLMRFEREARTLASLNHPNIAAIYGVEDADGHSALVMELVDGEDLAARLARGAIPIEEALPIARQIADALETAHDAGIVHRDLKPANVKVRSDGTVKVLDFGLAKATEPASATAAGSIANSPTIASPAMTAMGIVLGTAAYMAPEQAKGRPVDRRADIWAFGVVLYEMLTGRRAFLGEDVSDVLASVLRDAPDFSALPADTPAPMRLLLRRCLQKDPAKRLPSIGAARLEITEVLAAGPEAASAPAPAPAVTSRLWPALAAIATAAAVVLGIRYAKRPAVVVPESLVFTLPTAGQALGVNAISPDGRQVLYATRMPLSQSAELRVQSLGALGVRSVPAASGPFGGGFAVWSPDSRSVAFSVRPELRRSDLITGQTSTIVTLPNNLGIAVGPGAWGQDGTILYGTNSFETRSNGVWRVPATGGSPVQVTRVGAGEVAHAPSGFLPDGHHFLYFVERVDFTKTGEVRVGSIDASPGAQDTSTLFVSDGPAVFAPAHNGVPDCLLFASRGSLIAQPFDVRTLTLAGPPVHVAADVGGLVSAAPDGRLVYRAAGGDSAQVSELVRFDRTGRKLGTIGPPGNYGEVNALADGARLAVSRTDADGVGHVQIVDIARRLFTRLNPGNASDYADAVSRSGLVAYTSAPTGIAHDIYVRPASGVGDARLLVSSDTVKHPNDWSPDGRYLIYDDHVPNRAQDLLIVRSDGGTPVPFLATDADETFGQFSPDGKWIAYRSTESGRAEVYVRDFAPGHAPAYGTEKVQVSVSGGDKPRWSPDGREIFYLRPDGMLMAAPVHAGTHVDVKEPVELFQTHAAGYYPYSVMPDGTFVVNTQTNAGDTTAPPIVVMINWSLARLP